MRTIIFDFDGTIADSFGVLLGIFEAVTGRKQNLTPAEVEELRSKSLREIIKYLKIKKWQIPKLLIRAKRIIAIKISSIEPFEGMPEALKKLHADNYQMYILSTNSSANISKFLRKNGLDSYFVRIYGDIGLRSKASALKKLMKKESVPLSRSLYIGDEVRDIEAGRKIGIPVISVGWGFNHPETLKKASPTALATSPQVLLKILEKY